MNTESTVNAMPTFTQKERDLLVKSVKSYRHLNYANNELFDTLTGLLNKVETMSTIPATIKGARLESTVAGVNIQCLGQIINKYISIPPLEQAVNLAVTLSTNTVEGIVSIILHKREGYVVITSDLLEKYSDYDLIAEYRDGKETFENYKED